MRNQTKISEIKQKIQAAKIVEEAAKRVRNFAVWESVNVVSVIKKNASITGAATEAYSKTIEATKVVDESNKEIRKLRPILETGYLMKTKIQQKITMQKLFVQTINDEEKKKAEMAKLAVEKMKLEDAKRRISAAEEEILKKTISKWKNMANAELVVEEADKVTKTIATTLN